MMPRLRRTLRTSVRLAAAAAAAGALLAGPAFAAGAKDSSCVSCHTDAERLKAECAAIPQPQGSALQAGKG